MPVPVLSVEQMRAWEAATWATGRTEATVIARVGERLAAWLCAHSRPGDAILVLAGKGHNGDDARAAVPHLTGRKVEVLNVSDPVCDLPQLEAALARRPVWVVDGLFGIGLNRPLSEAWCRFLATLNASGCRVVAVDVPSGLDADSGQPRGAAVRATCTLTLGAPKPGLLRTEAVPFTGRLEVIPDIGLIPCPLDSALQWMLAEDFADWPPPRPVHGHKGTFGHLAIVAGSAGYHGAAVLSARGAQRARPGLISLITMPEVYVAVAAQLQAVMVHSWGKHPELPGRFTALLLGPGLASDPLPAEVPATIDRLWREASVPVIVDASGLPWVPTGPLPVSSPRVLTPHPGEAAHLLGMSPAEVQRDRLAALRALSEQYGNAWVVLKGYQTLIGRSQGPVYVNPSGNPDLAQGGSGDVLAGYLAGWLAHPSLRADPLRVLQYAVWQHGATADWLSTRSASWVVEDLAGHLGSVRPATRTETVPPES